MEAVKCVKYLKMRNQYLGNNFCRYIFEVIENRVPPEPSLRTLKVSMLVMFVRVSVSTVVPWSVPVNVPDV